MPDLKQAWAFLEKSDVIAGAEEVQAAIRRVASQIEARLANVFPIVLPVMGGAVVFAPDHVRENFRPSTDHGGHDDEVRGLRYLEWTWDPDPVDTTYTVEYAYLLRDRDGSVRLEHDRHIEGLFSRADWLRWLTDAGFRTRVLPFDHSELEPGTYEVFVGTLTSAQTDRRTTGT